MQEVREGQRGRFADGDSARHAQRPGGSSMDSWRLSRMCGWDTRGRST